MAFENFLTNEFKIAISLLTVSSILLLIGNLTKKKEFENIKGTLLWLFWASLLFLVGSIFYTTQVGFGLTVIGAVGFIFCLIAFAIQLTIIVWKSN